MTNTLLSKRYQLEERLGSGGMAIVYKARDLMLERTVAIKVLRKDYSHDPAFRERFRQEAKAAANLSHPNIVTVHDFGIDQGRIFIVMEFVPGATLKELIEKRGRYSIKSGISLLVQACAGVGYAHRAGLVHCDVKPQNMLVTPDRRLKVTDFGIARALASIRPEERTQIVWGSPQYFSPEQASGNSPSPASDVYSLGIVLYEVLLGQLPFIAESGNELARLHREENPRPPKEIRPTISDNLNRIILKVLSKEPSTRYRTADQLGRVLITFSKEEKSSVATATPRKETQQQRQSLRPEPIRQQPKPVQSPTLPPSMRAAPKNNSALDIDFTTALLSLIALLSVGGLIPFWLWIYYSVFR
ncbi:MAG: serine/threonine protein kinase [Anaerolineales bacterium]|nr:serine/threonine protein kinase [Chloroflexota bacterium]MBL6980727.1 serine/threonine protein kinase [Anaerolineales bacterium]